MMRLEKMRAIAEQVKKIDNKGAVAPMLCKEKFGLV